MSSHTDLLFRIIFWRDLHNYDSKRGHKFGLPKYQVILDVLDVDLTLKFHSLG